MAKKKKHTTKAEPISITREELKDMKFNVTIKVPKEDFDSLIKAMMGGEKQIK